LLHFEGAENIFGTEIAFLHQVAAQTLREQFLLQFFCFAASSFGDAGSVLLRGFA
jgi:hypothetical protein